MTFVVTCICGASVSVSAAQSGTKQKCACGHLLEVPSLRDLKATHQREDQHDDANNEQRVAMLVALAASVILSFFLIRVDALVLVPLLMIFVGKFWFLGVMVGEMGGAALLVFAIPFFDWLFLFKRFDVAWKPVLLQALGVAWIVLWPILLRAA